MMQVDGNREPLGYAQDTDLAAASGLPPVSGSSLPDRVRVAIVQAEGADIRYRCDATNPTAAVGMLLKQNDTIWFTGKLHKVRVIQVSAGAKLNVEYFA